MDMELFNLDPEMKKVVQFTEKHLRPAEKYNKMTISCKTGIAPVRLFCLASQRSTGIPDGRMIHFYNKNAL